MKQFCRLFKLTHHLQTKSRDPNRLYELMRFDSTQAEHFQAGCIIALIDDVLTSGSHFTAASRRLIERFPEAEIIGIFWARADVT